MPFHDWTQKHIAYSKEEPAGCSAKETTFSVRLNRDTEQLQEKKDIAKPLKCINIDKLLENSKATKYES